MGNDQSFPATHVATQQVDINALVTRVREEGLKYQGRIESLESRVRHLEAELFQLRSATAAAARPAPVIVHAPPPPPPQNFPRPQFYQNPGGRGNFNNNNNYNQRGGGGRGRGGQQGRGGQNQHQNRQQNDEKQQQPINVQIVMGGPSQPGQMGAQFGGSTTKLSDHLDPVKNKGKK